MSKPTSRARSRGKAAASPSKSGRSGGGAIARPQKKSAPTRPCQPIELGEDGATRPSAYDPGLAATICRRLAEGESLRRICEDKTLPTRQTLRHWLDTVPAFAEQYQRSRQHQADALIDTAIETAHGALAHDNAASVRVKIDALLKLAAQLGGRLRGEAAGHPGNLDLAAAIAAARSRLAKARRAQGEQTADQQEP